MSHHIPIDLSLIAGIYKPVLPDAHKGTQGHALIVAGSYGKMGAAVLSARAALHAGAGLVTAFVPSCGYVVMQASVPEVMVLTDRNARFLSHIDYNVHPQAVGIGPGIGQDLQTHEAFRIFLGTLDRAIVIDADALNILSVHPDWIRDVPENSILTPHRKELERLIGTWETETDRDTKVRALSKSRNLTIVVKGAPTRIICGSETYENTTGNAALATAGSGDVLTGIITGLLAQGFPPLHAAQLGVYLHGLTADLAVSETSVRAFTASDIIAYLGKAFLAIETSEILRNKTW